MQHIRFASCLHPMPCLVDPSDGRCGERSPLAPRPHVPSISGIDNNPLLVPLSLHSSMLDCCRMVVASSHVSHSPSLKFVHYIDMPITKKSRRKQLPSRISKYLFFHAKFMDLSCRDKPNQKENNRRHRNL